MYFQAMKPELYNAILFGDLHAIKTALVQTSYSDFLDRPAELAEILHRARNEFAFPAKYRSSQARFFADAIIAKDSDSSVRYLRRVFKRLDEDSNER